MLDLISEAQLVLLIGLVGGVVLGLAARLGQFCTLGMIEDVHYGDDRGRLWMWVAALGVAMLANFGASAAGLIDLGQTIYLSNRYSVFGAILGGLLFGYGMAQAGNCGYGMLARLGGGDLRALMIALVMGVAAYVTISGLFSPIRATLFPTIPEPDTATGYAHILSGTFGVSPAAIGGVIGAVLIVAALRWIGPRDRLPRLFWGAMVGLAISSGFVGTYWVATHGFEALRIGSHTFTAPIGDAIRYVMFSTVLAPSFGIGSVLGVVMGGFIGSVIRDGFRWEACEDPRELKRQLAGGALMGVGAVLAAGCSVGQGLSALSLLSITAPLVAASIWVGAWLGLRHLIVGLVSAN
ncbi:YeeE/YedE family protein [Fontisubflavum oceani]|uniref:YeeE/YedE family protein n=1 Tax=Fontisubflavum oceani TaxID=2978973 RepID=UPI0025B51F63|nr:YeeE/YedE family protein [Fontisubflavum oceani]WJY20493.1 YeeE/YedE family protein [Fontisubflavum oceani]